MKTSLIIAITVFIIRVICAVLVTHYKREITDFLSKDETKAKIAELCIRAEKYFTGTKQGKDRLAYVCGVIVNLIPEKLRAYVTQEMLEQAVNAVFLHIAKRMEDGSLVAVEQ